jgi:hypothetical protein
MKIKILFLSFLIALVPLYSGCVRSYLVHIDSISDRTAQVNKVYQILPGNKDTGANDLQFKEFAGYLVKTLSIQGYRLAGAEEKAEMEIYLSYGMGEPEKHTYSYSEPVWGQTGAEIYSQSTQVNNPDNSTSQQSMTYVEPQYGVTGYTTQTGEYTSYKKYAIIDAYDIKNGVAGQKLKEIWKTSVSSSGKTKDLRKIFPALMAASVKYIGENTGEEISVNIGEDSETLKAIKNY